jgi:hypothetical protein
MSYQFSLDELYALEEMANDAIFASRKRLQHCQGKVNLNVEGCDSILEESEEECRNNLKLAGDMYVKLYDIRCEMEDNA